MGITLGAGTLIAGAVNRKNLHEESFWLTSLSRYVDIRILLIGSLFPDIIDKPVGQYFFRDTFSNGRIFSHSLLFLLVLASAGFFLFKRYRQVWLLTLAAGTLSHLILDGMWTVPHTLFWPVMGFTFEKYELTNWLANVFQALFHQASAAIPELIGLFIILWFMTMLVWKKRTGVFLRYGRF
jgi:inner membrane protein